jgi:hypothetical protein
VNVQAFIRTCVRVYNFACDLRACTAACLKPCVKAIVRFLNRACFEASMRARFHSRKVSCIQVCVLQSVHVFFQASVRLSELGCNDVLNGVCVPRFKQEYIRASVLICMSASRRTCMRNFVKSVLCVSVLPYKSYFVQTFVLESVCV